MLKKLILVSASGANIYFLGHFRGAIGHFLPSERQLKVKEEESALFCDGY